MVGCGEAQIDLGEDARFWPCDEALARWRRPDGAVVSPGVFVPIAEELGLIHLLGKSVMRDACFAAAGWNAKGIVSSVAVNISPHQFDDPDFVNSVYQALDDSGLPPNLLELEITESVIMQKDYALTLLEEISECGVELAIDDFGTGYSCLAYLKDLPAKKLKLDRAFILGLPEDRKSFAIVRTVTQLARDLGMTVVAEGVEYMSGMSRCAEERRGGWQYEPVLR